MESSFKAKQALNAKEFSKAYELYEEAAELESKAAEFYFERADLEPTRSIIIRSAAFLNLKAGRLIEAQKFIFFGLTHSQDQSIIEQLNDALELLVSLKNLSPTDITREYNYLAALRQRSMHYILEPETPFYGKSVKMEALRDFSDSYLKSLKAFAKVKLQELYPQIDGSSLRKSVEKVINPLITSTSYGSFKFSIANDILQRPFEETGIIEFKSNIIYQYHHEIFTLSLDDNQIDKLKDSFDQSDVNQIFRPISKIRSRNSGYNVGYYDSENYRKRYIKKLLNKQKKRLLPPTPYTEEQIGDLVSQLTHIREGKGGRKRKTTIREDHLRQTSFDREIRQISPANEKPIIFHEGIIISVFWESDSGFKIEFEDFDITAEGVVYEDTLKEFYQTFYDKLILLANLNERNPEEQKNWDAIKNYIGNINTLTKK